VRLRLWVDPPAGYSDLQSVLAMARRAKAAGMRILLDPHYSDFWADPQKQPTPAAWAGQDLPTLAATVRAYTRDALNALSAQGTPAQMLQLGNEIRNGILWPTGQLDGTQAKWDVIGLSYYPFWHGTLSQLRTNLDDLSQRCRRDIAVVETQYGWTLDNGDQENNFLWTSDLLVPVTRRHPAASSASPPICCRSSARYQTIAGSASSTGSPSGFRESAGSPAPARRTTT